MTTPNPPPPPTLAFAAMKYLAWGLHAYLVFGIKNEINEGEA